MREPSTNLPTLVELALLGRAGKGVLSDVRPEEEVVEA